MRITLCGQTALRAWRAIRTGAAAIGPNGIDGLGAPCELEQPSPEPFERWSRGAIGRIPRGLVGVPTPEHPLHVAVPSAPSRVRGELVRSSVYARDLPDGAFVSLGDGLAVASPELVFVEMGALMQPAVHLALGLELCGRFSRDPESPRTGEVAYDVAPLTTPTRLREFAASCRRFANLRHTRLLAELVREEAWSPMEAVVASLLTLPVSEFGYGLDRISLNPRVSLEGRASTGESRVPDVLFEGTHVGINYDGERDHLGLGEVADAVAEGSAPRIDDAVRTARTLVVGDKRRDRDLLVAGYKVLPITSEDLYERGGLDLAVRQVFALIESETGCDLGTHRQALARASFVRERQRLLWSLLPGERGARLLRELADESAGLGEFRGRVEESWLELDI